MKKILLASLMFCAVVASSCGNNNGETDSKEVAKDQNADKFDSTAALDDAKFAVAAADGGMMEVELGKLALANSNSSKVKEFAQMMVDDHSKINEELKALAAKKNISLPDSMSNAHRDTYNDLAKKKRTDFDKAYISKMLDDHKDDIAAFKKQAEKGNDTELRTWAADKLPILEHHLMMAQSSDSTVRKQ